VVSAAMRMVAKVDCHYNNEAESDNGHAVCSRDLVPGPTVIRLRELPRKKLLLLVEMMVLHCVAEDMNPGTRCSWCRYSS
jgi:hypothetical protein